jgi:hypothetical protein
MGGTGWLSITPAQRPGRVCTLSQKNGYRIMLRSAAVGLRTRHPNGWRVKYPVVQKHLNNPAARFFDEMEMARTVFPVIFGPESPSQATLVFLGAKNAIDEGRAVTMCLSAFRWSTTACSPIRDNLTER